MNTLKDSTHRYKVNMMLGKNMYNETGYDADGESGDAASDQCDSDDGPSDDEDYIDGGAITEHNLVREHHCEEIFNEAENSNAVLDMNNDSKSGNVSFYQHGTVSDKIEDDEHTSDEVYDKALDPRGTDSMTSNALAQTKENQDGVGAVPEVDGKLSPSDKPYDDIGSTCSDTSDDEETINARNQEAIAFRRLVANLKIAQSEATEITPNPGQSEYYDDLPYEYQDVSNYLSETFNKAIEIAEATSGRTSEDLNGYGEACKWFNEACECFIEEVDRAQHAGEISAAFANDVKYVHLQGDDNPRRMVKDDWY